MAVKRAATGFVLDPTEETNWHESCRNKGFSDGADAARFAFMSRGDALRLRYDSCSSGTLSFSSAPHTHMSMQIIPRSHTPLSLRTGSNLFSFKFSVSPRLGRGSFATITY